VDATVVKGGRRVLDCVTTCIGQGEHTAIVGPNGSGKSTLVNLLTLQDRPLARADVDHVPPVRVFGSATWNVFDLRTRLGVVSADMHHRFVIGNSMGRITGLDAVLSGFFASHGVTIYGDVTDEMQALAREALERMDASPLAERHLDEMSSGEARRVLLARALVGRPTALVLDEPTTGLDVVARHRLLERVRRIAREGTTLILVTHHVEEIVPEIETLVLLRRGCIFKAGSTRTILTPSNLAETFGAPVELTELSGRYYVRPV
jgi:iron complex transport system ATP-binding protein